MLHRAALLIASFADSAKFGGVRYGCLLAKRFFSEVLPATSNPGPSVPSSKPPVAPIYGPPPGLVVLAEIRRKRLPLTPIRSNPASQNARLAFWRSVMGNGTSIQPPQFAP